MQRWICRVCASQGGDPCYCEIDQQPEHCLLVDPYNSACWEPVEEEGKAVEK